MKIKSGNNGRDHNTVKVLTVILKCEILLSILH